MRVIGLTGQSGAGKSTVSAIWRKMGIPVLDCDLFAREIVESPECLAELTEAFSQEILHPDGTLNRRLLGAKAFATPEGTQTLNAITLPRILDGIKETLATRYADCPLVVLDAPTLFESGADRLCQQVVAVVASQETLVRRIVKRDGITPAQAADRLARQKPVSFFEGRAILLQNDKSRLALWFAARRLGKRLLEGKV